MLDDVCLIVNPAAGGGRAGRTAGAVQERLASLTRGLRRIDTRDLEHARELARDASLRGETTVALGGDGLVGALADELRAHPNSVLAVLPGGRGNDLARVLGVEGDPLRACAALPAARLRAVDVGEVTADGAAAGRAFVGIASVGFDSDANRIANEAPAWLGGLVYAYGALRALLGWRPARFEIEMQPGDRRHAFAGYSVAAANSKAYGGGMLAAPDALLDDGLLEVVAIEHVRRLRFLANLPRVFKGTHVEQAGVRVFRATEVHISCDRPFTVYADGDPIAELPATVRALPGAVRMLVPDHGGSAAFSAPSPAQPPRAQPIGHGPPASDAQSRERGADGEGAAR